MPMPKNGRHSVNTNKEKVKIKGGGGSIREYTVLGTPRSSKVHNKYL